MKEIRKRENGREYIIEDCDAMDRAGLDFSFLAELYRDSPEILITRESIRSRFHIVYEARLFRGSLKNLEHMLSLQEKVELLTDIFHKLKKIHGKGYIFNNLNLESSYLCGFRSVLITGFQNIVRKYSQGEGIIERVSAVNSHYMPPELTGKLGIPLSEQSDFYSFGILMYRFLTGQYPFHSDDLIELYSLHMAGKPVDPGLVKKDIPSGLSQIILKLLAKEPEERYRSHDGLIYDLENFSHPGFVPGQRDYEPRFRLSRTLYGRERERELLTGEIAGAASGRFQTVLLSGYAGVGKSSLIDEIFRSERQRGMIFLRGKFQQYRSNIPFQALSEALSGYIDRLLTGSSEDLERFRDDFASRIGDQGAVLTSVFPRLETVTGKQIPVYPLTGIQGENRFILTFLEFLRIIADRKSPLILFLDDFEWTDPASLHVIRQMIRARLDWTFLGISYRNDEISEHHPLMLLIEEARILCPGLKEIRLKDLICRDISRMLRESRILNYEELASAVFEKTGGNPFYVHQYMNMIIEKKLLERQSDSHLWKADTASVREEEVCGNVVEFMQTLLKNYDREVIEILRKISMLGHQTDDRTLELLLGKDREEIRIRLKEVLAQKLMTDTGTALRFTHDKIQQACYQLNGKDQLGREHFALACLLMDNRLYSDSDDLFSLVSHLNESFAFVLKEPARFFDIYLAAAVKSREISAYQEYRQFIGQGRRLLCPEITGERRKKCLSEYHLALHLNGEYEEADDFFEREVREDRDIYLFKENYIAKVSQDSMLGKYGEATQLGLSILEKLGISLDHNPDRNALTEGLRKNRELAEQLGIERVDDLDSVEKSHSGKMEFICEMISALLSGSFFHSPNLSVLLILETIRLAMIYGVFPAMGYPLSFSSILFILTENDYFRGFDYGKYAINISQIDKRSLGHAKHIFILTSWQWKRPLKDNRCLDIARDAFHLLLKGGDIQMSGFIFANTVGCLFERGERLSDCLDELNRGLDYVGKTNNFHALGGYQVYEQFFLSMMSRNAPENDFIHNGFREKEFLEINSLNFVAQAYLYIYKTQYLFMNRQYGLARVYAGRAEKILHSITAFLPVGTFYFYGALLLCRALGEDSGSAEKLRTYMDQLEEWAGAVPENWLQKYYLVKAESIRFSESRSIEAAQFYTMAIIAAEQNGFIQDLALAQELFSEYWLEQGSGEWSFNLLEQACESYRKWGAALKLNALLRADSRLAAKVERKNIDLRSIIKAQNLLARETRLDMLIQKMLKMLLDFSGAEICHLIRCEEEWFIEASLGIADKDVSLTRKKISTETLSTDLVNYVVRTKNEITPEELSIPVSDSYYKKFHPLSTIVVPLLNHSETIGILYLEHRRVKGLFSGEKREAIRMLSSQIAVSLLNAELYGTLEGRVKERTEELEEMNKELLWTGGELRKINKTKDKLLSILGHDLKGPLGGVAKFMELMDEGKIQPSEKLISTMNKSIGNIYNLTEDLLLWARSQSGALVPCPEEIRAGTLIDQVMGVYRMAAEKKKITLVAEGIAEGLALYTDSSMADTILRNLVNNGVKFTPRGGRVSIRAGERENMVRLEVSDTGVGMEKEVSESLFSIVDKSRQRRGTDDESGTGLGLVVCRELAGLCGGDIGAESTPGVGSTFWVEFPRSRGE